MAAKPRILGLRPRRPSAAMVVALIALGVALSGTTYAITALPKNSVGRRQLQKNAVVSSKVKNGTLLRKDLKGGLPTGPTGTTGAQGATGPAGATGPDGATGPQGGAFAFAKVSATGVIDGAGTQNVSAAHEVGNAYCLTVSSQPHNGVASLNADGGATGGFAVVLARQLSLSDLNFWVNQGCAANTNAIVQTFDHTGAGAAEPFMVAFFG